VNQRQTLCVSLVAGALLLAGCGAQGASQLPAPALVNATPAPSGTGPNTAPAAAGSGPSAAAASAGNGPSTDHAAAGANPATQPSAEGSGPESPRQKSSGAVSLTVATLPVGAVGTLTDKNVCVDVNWLGNLRPQVTLKLTSVTIDGPFTTGDAAAAGCTEADGPSCAGLQLTDADNGAGLTCATGAQWTGVAPKNNPSLVLSGELDCAPSDAAACEQTRSDLQARSGEVGPATLNYDLPPDTSSPAPGGPSAPATADTSSPSAPGPSSPSAPSSPDTSSPSAPDTGAPSSPAPGSSPGA
jgi:hypothetical protein